MRLLLVLLLAASAHAQGTGTLAGLVTDAATGEALPGASVHMGGTNLRAIANFSGEYRIIGIPVGTYTVTAWDAYYQSQTVTNVTIRSGYTTPMPFALEVNAYPSDAGGTPLFIPDTIALRVNASPGGVCTGPLSPPVIARGAYVSRVMYRELPSVGGCQTPDTPNGVASRDAW